MSSIAFQRAIGRSALQITGLLSGIEINMARSWFGLAVAALLVNLVLVVSMGRQRAAAAAIVDSLQIVQRRANMYRGEAASYRRTLFRQDLSSGFLRGTNASTGAPLSLDAPRDGVYYVIDIACAACARSLPFLNTLADSGMIQVVGITYDDPRAVQAYMKSHAIRFTVLTEPKGKLAALIPGNLAPVTFLVSSGVLNDVLTGSIPIDVQERLLRKGLIAAF